MIEMQIKEEMRPAQVQYIKYICDRCERHITLPAPEKDRYQWPDGWYALKLSFGPEKSLCAFCTDELNKWLSK